jgi:predicted transcriptional regulator
MAKQSARSKEREPTLPDSELEVLRVLWKASRATAREVWQTLQSTGSKWTYATVNTLLQRLEAKGLAVSDKSQMTYVYSPKISKQQVVKRRVRQLVDKLYDGQGGLLVMHLLKSQNLSKEEVSEIHQILSGTAKDHGA